MLCVILVVSEIIVPCCEEAVGNVPMEPSEGCRRMVWLFSHAGVEKKEKKGEIQR